MEASGILAGEGASAHASAPLVGSRWSLGPGCVSPLVTRGPGSGFPLGLRVDPAAVAADELDEARVGLPLGHVALDPLLPHVEIDAARAAADVSEVGIRHLARAVHDASHDGDLEPSDVPELGLDARRRRLP